VRLSLLTHSDRLSPRALALLESLTMAGHEVSVARPASGRLRRRRLTAIDHPLATDRSPRPDPTIIWPVVSTLVDEADRIADQLDAWVARRPDWPEPNRDLVRVVPARPELSTPVRAPVPERRPWEQHAGVCQLGRHAGKTVVLAYRSTPASPGHLLRRALERAGVEVRVVERVDLDAHSDADFVLVIESPSPPIRFSGSAPIPVVFWVHHGEHHLDGNLRLARQYRADLVLMAHSWHLAGRFAVPVERFPFAVAPELAQGAAWSGRDIDLAFVGRTQGRMYRRRVELIEQARGALRSVEAVGGVGPAEMMSLYRRSKMVLNEGGTRHFPITMRVFEAIGAGALLVTDPAPGLEELFEGGYITIDQDGLDTGHLQELLDTSEASTIAGATYEKAIHAHTYDHRVDLLMRHTDGLMATATGETTGSDDPVEVFLARHPYCQRVLDAAGRITEAGREVWRPKDLTDEPKPGSYDLVALSDRSRPALARAARRYVIGWGVDPDRLGLTYRSVSMVDDMTVIDLGADAYDVATVGGPSAFD
jgi:hypothetical protein